jgi:lipoate-protein ligase A
LPGETLPTTWVVERRSGTAGELHGPWPSDEGLSERRIAICRVTRPALVIGSTQQFRGEGGVVAAGERLEVVRRGTGGGAVLVVPDGQVWVDAFLPRGDPLWNDDVIASSRWLGDCWAMALTSLGVQELHVAARTDRRRDPGLPACFAGVVAGEVVSAGRKIVGIAQRRDRRGARFVTMVPASWGASGVRRLVGAMVAAGIAPRPRGAGGPFTSTLQGAAVGLREAVGSAETSDRGSLRDLVERAEQAFVASLQ